jgi:hypothetical protein
MRRTVTMLVIVVASVMIAFLCSPPDPITFWIVFIGLLHLSFLSYLAGLKEGRILGGTKEYPKVAVANTSGNER